MNYLLVAVVCLTLAGVLVCVCFHLTNRGGPVVVLAVLSILVTVFIALASLSLTIIGFQKKDFDSAFQAAVAWGSTFYSFKLWTR